MGRFGVELLRDDTATHIAGIRINLFTATFVFLGAVVYMLLAPKGREDPATLRGWADPEEDEESPVEEFAEELVAAAKGSAPSSEVWSTAQLELTRLNQIGNQIEDLSARTAELRGYL